MSIIDAVILGGIQGLTEFLPVSSSAHLVMGKELLGFHPAGITFEVFVHFGTLMSVLAFYRRTVIELIRACMAAVVRPREIGAAYRSDRNFRWSVYIILGTIPAGVIGVLFEKQIERTFGNARMAAAMLVITGILLLLTRYIRPEHRELSLARATLVGFAQALAILPGISRSGATICAAQFLGIGREEAVRFSFLLSIPVILGATVLKMAELLVDTPGVADLFGIAAGTVTAFISGYGAIKLLVLIARGGKLDYFAWYCFAIGIAGWVYF